MFFGHHKCPYYQIISKNRVSNPFEIWRVETIMSHFGYILAAFHVVKMEVTEVHRYIETKVNTTQCTYHLQRTLRVYLPNVGNIDNASCVHITP